MIRAEEEAVLEVKKSVNEKNKEIAQAVKDENRFLKKVKNKNDKQFLKKVQEKRFELHIQAEASRLNALQKQHERL